MSGVRPNMCRLFGTYEPWHLYVPTNDATIIIVSVEQNNEVAHFAAAKEQNFEQKNLCS